MSISPPSRPIFILIIILLAGVGLVALRPANESLSPVSTGTPISGIIRRATPTPAPSSTPDWSTAVPAKTPLLSAAEGEPTTEVLREGQRLLTPTPALAAEHIVQPGESLDSIANLYGITAASIAAINYLLNPDLLYPGQTLLIPLPPKPTLAPAKLEATVAAAVEEAAVGSDAAVLGYSVLDHPIELYTFGDGPNTLILVGGIHGGYEWNSTVLAYEFVNYFREHPTAVPETVAIHIIPAANPDGVFAVTSKEGPIAIDDILVPDNFQARFNANGVDLNRNWNCDWTAAAVWWDEFVSGGAAPYSEVENQILLAFIESQAATLRGVVFWHSSAFLVSPGQCGDDPHQPSEAMAGTYALAARYPVGAFNAYPVTGDASDALVQMGIPSFSVELSTHESIDWARNLAGVRALLALFDQE